MVGTMRTHFEKGFRAADFLADLIERAPAQDQTKVLIYFATYIHILQRSLRSSSPEQSGYLFANELDIRVGNQSIN